MAADFAELGAFIATGVAKPVIYKLRGDDVCLHRQVIYTQNHLYTGKKQKQQHYLQHN